MERKDGSFACFKKQSKNGLNYFNGTLSLDGKEYWISIFNSHTKNGEQYLSGSVQLKEKKEVSSDDYIKAKEGGEQW